MGCAVSLRRAADAADASVAPEEVRAARAASLRARECADALLKWRRAFAGLVDAIEGTCYVAAIWAEDERDIPFSSAFKSLSLAATELAAASPTLLEALDAHAELLADLISRQREHHNAVQDAANQIAHFTAVCKKLAAILETPLSFSSMPRLGMISLARGTSVETLLLAPSRALAGPNGRPRNNEHFALGNRSTAADPEVIFTGDSTIDLAPRKRARAALDMALRGEQQKWNVYNTTCDERMYEAVARLLFAQGELWEKFAKVFARMLAICKQYAAAQIGNTNNSNKNPGTPLLDSVDGAASPWLQHRKSVTATANRALFVNPETDQKICKHRLIFIKRWHYLAEVSCKLWIDLRSCEIEFVESSFDWFEMDKQPHCIIRDSDCYGFDDGTELPDIAPKRLFLDLLDKWGDTLRSPLQPLSGGDMNLQKPFSVVKTCFQYAERTLLNVNEREKAALDLLKKLKKMSKMAKPSTTGAQPGSHKLEALQHKFDKSLVENRAFRRTKLMKSQTELWRGLESCTRFSSSVYLFLACQYKDKIVGIGQDETVDELVNSEPIANNSNVVLSTEERDNERSRNPLKQTVESDCPVPTQKSSGVMQISDLFFGVQRNFASRTKSLSRKVYPDSDATEAPEESGEFNGLSQQDECLLNSRSNLLRSRMGSIFSPDSFPKVSDRSLTHQGSQDLLRPSPVAGPPQSSSNADLKLLSADEIKDASANTTHEESVKEIKLHTNQSNTDKFEVMPDVTRLAPEPPTAADPSRIERKDSEMPSSLGIATEIASATGVAEEENHFGNITDAPPQYETVAQQIDQEAPVEKKRHKKKKHKDESSEKRRHRKKTASTAHSGDYTEGSDQGHRKHRRKKDKGPPPPPPINPALFHEGPEMIVSEINTPSVIVSSSARNSVYNVLPAKRAPYIVNPVLASSDSLQKPEPSYVYTPDIPGVGKIPSMSTSRSNSLSRSSLEQTNKPTQTQQSRRPPPPPPQPPISAVKREAPYIADYSLPENASRPRSSASSIGTSQPHETKRKSGSEFKFSTDTNAPSTSMVADTGNPKLTTATRSFAAEANKSSLLVSDDAPVRTTRSRSQIFNVDSFSKNSSSSVTEYVLNSRRKMSHIGALPAAGTSGGLLHAGSGLDRRSMARSRESLINL